jgi:uncharacterized protein
MERLKIRIADLDSDNPVSGCVENYVCESLKDLSKAQRLTIEYTLTPVDEEILCNGLIRGEIELECSRCLKVFDFPVRIKLGCSYSAKDELIDLNDEASQLLLLGMPSKPLCKESCAGLCCSCGKNLNDGVCFCKKDEQHPQWEKLKLFLSPGKDSKIDK